MQIVHAQSVRDIIPTPGEKSLVLPSHTDVPEGQEGGRLSNFPGLPLRFEYPRGISRPGRGRECKGSTSPAQSDVSDQIAGGRHGLPKGSRHTEHPSGLHQPRTQHPAGRPCRPGTWLNPAMEHTDSMERDSEYLERRRRCALFRELSQPDRVLLEWRVVDGWDYAEIALRLGVPPADLVKRVQRIRTDLRRRAKALGAGETQFKVAATVTI